MSIREAGVQLSLCDDLTCFTYGKHAKLSLNKLPDGGDHS